MLGSYQAVLSTAVTICWFMEKWIVLERASLDSTNSFAWTGPLVSRLKTCTAQLIRIHYFPLLFKR